jgi:alkylation response protein AidB-like acyl-CoA dehydrogenase
LRSTAGGAQIEESADEQFIQGRRWASLLRARNILKKEMYMTIRFDGKVAQYRSSWMTEELDAFRDQFRDFLAKDLAPHAEKWRHQKMVDRSAWRSLGEMGALLTSVPETYGGLGGTFAYDAAVFEDMESVVPEALGGVGVSSGVVAHYILNYGSEEQKRRWLPGMARAN